MSDRDLMPPVFDLLRITIELSSPMTIGGAEQDDLQDHAAVLDANGLPTLPGSSIAGVLRHALAEGDPDEDPGIRVMFGYQKEDDGASSRLWTSWGQVHDRNDRPFPMLALSEAQRRALKEDEVLVALSEGCVRDHVRLSARGVPADRGKFETLLVPRGARFTFEIGIAPPPDKKLRERFSVASVLGRLASPQVRLGGRTLRGFGSFELQKVLHRRFDLSKPEDADAWARLPRALEVSAPPGVLKVFPVGDTKATARSGWITLQRNYEPEDLLLPGGGDPEDWGDLLAARGPDASREPRVPVTERRIMYKGGQGTLAPGEPYVPGTSIKGALRHRVAFHARILAGALVDPDDPRRADDLDLDVQLQEQRGEPGAAAVAELFGRARGDEGQTGRLIVEDVPIKLQRAQWLDHVSLDRYSGGPMDGLLFSELTHANAGQLFLTLRMHLRLDGVSDPTLRALELAVEDLGRGRLAIGAGASRGHGYLQDIDKKSFSIPRSRP